jgi:hypothetical protein
VLPLAACGPDGQPLTIDIAWFGSDRPVAALIHSSGTHGVEGFAGSAIQLQFLEQISDIPSQAAVVLVHILNPFGMAWLRRTNSNNVDLNRNVLPVSDSYTGIPAGYVTFETFLNPPSRPSRDLFLLKAAWLIARYNMAALKEAIVTGQYERPMGLFFGGKELQEEAWVYQEYVSNRLGTARHVIAIDVHTGLGKFGHDTLFADPDAFERLHTLFGDRVAPLDADRSVGYSFRGGFHTMLPRVLPQARVDFVCQEFGTRGPISVLHALREENRWHHFGTRELHHPTKQRLKETFCPDQSIWRDAVLGRGQEILDRASRFLESGSSE